MASREVLIRFGTRNLKRARESMSRITKAVREAAKGIKDIEQRRAFLRRTNEAARENREILRAAGVQEARQRRANRIRRAALGDAPSADGLNRGVGLAGRLGSLGAQAGNLNLSGFLGGAFAFGGAAGAALAGVISIFDQLAKPIVEAEVAKQIANQEARLRAELQQAQFEADFARRLDEDVDFAQRQAKRFDQEIRAEQALLREPGGLGGF